MDVEELRAIIKEPHEYPDGPLIMCYLKDYEDCVKIFRYVWGEKNLGNS